MSSMVKTIWLFLSLLLSTICIGQTVDGFTSGGTGWYRKNFVIPENDRGKNIRILFEGVYMNADIWLNGDDL